MDELLVPNEYPHNIYGEVAIALQEGGSREGQEDEAQEQDGIECAIADICLVEDVRGNASEEVAHHSTHGELQDEGHEDAPPRAICTSSTSGDELDECDGEHVGHRVVTSALQLEDGAKSFLEMHIL